MRTYLTRLSCVVFAGTVIGGVLAIGPVSAAGAATSNDVTVCSGTPTAPGVLAGRHADVVVKGACEVNAGRAVVGGDLSVSPGSVLVAAFALNDKTGSGASSLSVLGSLHVGAGATMLLGCNPQNFPCLDSATLSSHDSVGGNLTSFRPLGVIVHNSNIAGSVTQTGGGGGVNCTPQGIFKQFNSPVYSAYEVASVGGDVTVTGMQSCWVGLVQLRVGDSMTVSHNTLADPDAIEILANKIAGDLTCHGDSMTWDSAEVTMGHLFPRIPQPNTVGGERAGQCVLSSPTKPGGHRGPGPF